PSHTCPPFPPFIIAARPPSDDDLPIGTSSIFSLTHGTHVQLRHGRSRAAPDGSREGSDSGEGPDGHPGADGGHHVPPRRPPPHRRGPHANRLRHRPRRPCPGVPPLQPRSGARGAADGASGGGFPCVGRLRTHRAIVAGVHPEAGNGGGAAGAGTDRLRQTAYGGGCRADGTEDQGCGTGRAEPGGGGEEDVRRHRWRGSSGGLS
ncbi:hypothetical protein MUK42_26661, partial [Musa troglodytarum]